MTSEERKQRIWDDVYVKAFFGLATQLTAEDIKAKPIEQTAQELATVATGYADLAILCVTPAEAGEEELPIVLPYKRTE